MPSSAFCLYALPPFISVFLRPRAEGSSEVVSVCSFLRPVSHDKGAAGEPWRVGGGPRKARAAVGEVISAGWWGGALQTLGAAGCGRVSQA